MSELQTEENIKQTFVKINAQIEEYNGKLQFISNGILQLKQGHETVIQQHVENNAAQTTEFQKKEQDLQAKQQEMSAMQENLNKELQAKNEEKNQMDAKIQELNSTLQTTNANNTTERENIQQQLAAVETEKIRQQEELERVKKGKDEIAAKLISTLKEEIAVLTQDKNRYQAKVEELLGYITSNEEQVTLLYDKIPKSIGEPINTMMTNYFQQGGYNWRTPSSKTFRTISNSKSMRSSSRRMSSKRSSKRITKKYKMKK
jgi:chromosome segregation ATPase